MRVIFRVNCFPENLVSKLIPLPPNLPYCKSHPSGSMIRKKAKPPVSNSVHTVKTERYGSIWLARKKYEKLKAPGIMWRMWERNELLLSPQEVGRGALKGTSSLQLKVLHFGVHIFS